MNPATLCAIRCKGLYNLGAGSDRAAPSLQGYPTCYPTSTSSTLRRCWCTARPEMSISASASTAGPGRSTASVCLTESYPTSTEANPPRQQA